MLIANHSALSSAQALSSSPKTFTMSDKWSTGLFDCTSDMETCCTVCFAGPGVPYARVNRIVYGSRT